MKKIPSTKLSDHSEETLLALIREVQKYRFLYDIKRCDRRAPEFVARRCEIWNEISLIFGFPASECLAIWNRLRSTFSRQFRIYQNSKYTGKVYNPNNWPFFDHLLFLIPFLEYNGQPLPNSNPNTSAPPANKSVIPSQTAANSLAKKALKRSKTLLLKTKEAQTPAMLSYSGFEISKLIELVKQYPVIYSSYPSRFKAGEVSSAWKSISTKMRCPMHDCITKWTSLWTKLRKATLYPQKTQWVWFSQMKEFIPYQDARAKRRFSSNYAEKMISDSPAQQYSTIKSKQSTKHRDEELSLDKLANDECMNNSEYHSKNLEETELVSVV